MSEPDGSRQGEGGRGPDRVGIALRDALHAERLRIVAGLIRVTGDWELAEDCLQDAAERALTTWPRDGVPANPPAWLTTTARRRAIDVLRRRGTESAALRQLVADNERDQPVLDAGGGYADDRLRLLFTCCHPSLAMADRVALTLRTVAGLSTREVARLLVVNEATMSQRLRRTRARIVEQQIELAVPAPDEIDDRIDAVLAVVYLIFTEGNASSGPGSGLRDELADETIALARLVVRLLPHDREAHALRALILLQHARRPARVAADGALVPLDEQDRASWDTPMIAAGLEALRLAREAGPDDQAAGTYRAQAKIAALHSTASDASDTDWGAILSWYDALLAATGSPIIALNRVVAVGMYDGPEAGFAALAGFADDPRLLGHPQVPAVRADLLRRAGRSSEALAAYREALAVATSDGARLYFERRIAELDKWRAWRQSARMRGAMGLHGHPGTGHARPCHFHR